MKKFSKSLMLLVSSLMILSGCETKHGGSSSSDEPSTNQPSTNDPSTDVPSSNEPVVIIITLDPSGDVALKVGDVKEFKATVKGDNNPSQEVTFSLEDVDPEGCVTLSENKVTAVAVGKATLKATSIANKDVSATAKITVSEAGEPEVPVVEEGPVVVTSPVDGETYKFGIHSKYKEDTEAKDYFITGNMAAKPAQFYFERTDSLDNAADVVYSKKGDGKCTLKVSAPGTAGDGKYIGVILVDSGDKQFVNIVYSADEAVLDYDSSKNSFGVTISGSKDGKRDGVYVIGGSSNYNTISAGTVAQNSDVAHLYIVENGTSIGGGDEPEKTDWTDAEKALMEEHLGGYVLPFVAIPEGELAYDEEYDCLSIVSESASKELVSSVKDVYVGKGFKAFDITNEENGLLSAFDMLFDNTANMVQVQVYYIDYGDGNPFFEIDAYSADIGEFPVDDLKDFMMDDIEVDAFPKPDGSRMYYEIISDFFSSAFIVHVLDANKETCEESFKAKLVEAGYTVSDPTDEEPYYYALSSEQTIEVYFVYDADYESFHIKIYEGARLYKEWPSEKVSSLVPEGIVVPAFDWDGGYNLIDSRDYASEDVEEGEEPDDPYIAIYCLGSEEAEDKDTFEKYCDILVGAGYIVEDYSDKDNKYKYFVAYDYFENVTITLDNFIGEFTITIYGGGSPWVRDLDTFPADKVKESLKEGSPEIPEPSFTEEGAKYNYALYEDGIHIRVNTGEAVAVDNYVAKLEGAGFVSQEVSEEMGLPEGAKVLHSEDESVEVVLYMEKDAGTKSAYLNIVLSNVGGGATTEGDGSFDLSTTKPDDPRTDDKAVYTSGDVTITVEKGESAQVVGNDGGAQMPAKEGHTRFYKNQIITISVPEGKSISSIVIDAGGGNGSSGIPSDIENCVVTREGDIVTITPNAGVSEVSFIFTAQVRVFSIDVEVA